jgi:hypothetical protein
MGIVGARFRNSSPSARVRLEGILAVRPEDLVANGRSDSQAPLLRRKLVT